MLFKGMLIEQNVEHHSKALDDRKSGIEMKRSDRLKKFG
jgi:hypothetical protein